MQSSRELREKVQQHQQSKDFQDSRQVVFQKTDTEKARLKELKKELKAQSKQN